MATGIIVVFSISIINLFFGFSLALLVGRGPKSWSDVESAFIIRPFSLRGIWPKKRKAVSATAGLSDADEDARSLPGDSGVSNGKPANSKLGCVVPGSDETNATPPIIKLGKVQLSPNRPVDAIEDGSCDVVLRQQLDEWRTGESSDIAVSAAMLTVAAPAPNQDETLYELVLESLRAAIVNQVRKDRRILSPSKGRFVWFLDDTSVEDALLPIERIRQTIEKTDYRYRSQSVDVVVQLSLAAGLKDDASQDLLNRLEGACDFARHEALVGVATDLGGGPKLATPIEMEVRETEQVLE